jgi:myo-inositol-1(or 4)-monophosphatase
MVAVDVLPALHAAVDAIAATLRDVQDWGLAGTRPGQHHADLATDAVGVRVLLDAGFAVLSEESGHHAQGRPMLAVLDPLDGSTNASRGIPWYATSVCVVDEAGPLAAVVANQANGVRYEAVRGGGTRRDGGPISPSGEKAVGHSLLGLSGYPPRRLGWMQYRALGAAALDLCAVADGVLDGYVDCSRDAHAAWDYLGAVLVCREAGALVEDAFGRDLVVREEAVRRTPVAAATPQLLTELLEARGSFV